MDLDLCEPESQVVEMLHAPQENSYFEDDFTGDGSVNEDVDMVDAERGDPDDTFTSLYQQAPPSAQLSVVCEETQNDSFRSVIEETQLAAIELETQTIESEQHADYPPPSPKETEKMALPAAGNVLAMIEIPPPVTLTREPEPPSPKFSFGKAPCRGPSIPTPNDASKQKVPLVQQRRNIPIDNVRGNVSKKPSPLGQPPLVPVVKDSVSQSIPSKPSATDPNGGDNRKMELAQTPATPTAQPQQGPQLPKSRLKSFKNRLGGPSKKSLPPPFPDVHRNNDKVNERQVKNSREEHSASVPTSVSNNQHPFKTDVRTIGKKDMQQQNTHEGQHISGVELSGQQHDSNYSTKNLPSELGPESQSSEVDSPPVRSLSESTRHALEDISNIEKRNAQSNAHSSTHDQSEAHTSPSVPRAVPSRPRSVTPFSDSPSRTSQSRAASFRPVNRPITEQESVPQGLPKHTNGNKVCKTYARQNRYKFRILEAVIPDILAKMKVYEASVGPLGHLSTELEERREIIETQHNENIALKESLLEAKAELQSVCRVKLDLEKDREELSKKVEKLKQASEKYKYHMNDVVSFQKDLKTDSIDLQRNIKILYQEAQKEIATQRADVETNIIKFDALLAEIKEVRGKEDERNKELSEKIERNTELRNQCEELNSIIKENHFEIKRKNDHIEMLEKQFSDIQLERHKELMDILQRPQVNNVEELCEEGGMLHKILNTGTSTEEKLEKISTAINDVVKRESEWPGTLREILEETSFALQEKFQDGRDKDSAFHKSSIKIFEDLRERVLQFNIDQEKNAQLSDRLVELQETNATLKASLDSKENESEVNITRLKELMQELVDVRAQLANKNDQLSAAVAQPRDDPEAKRKIADLTTETSRLQDLLNTANYDKRQSKQDLQASQELIAAVQKQLCETEAKLQAAETGLRHVQSTSKKFQIECKNAVEKARQDIITTTAGEKREMAAQHNSMVEDLRKKYTETESQLQIALKEVESSKKLNNHQAAILSELKSDIAICKSHLQQHREEIQVLNQFSMPTEELARQKQELSLFRQAFAEHQSAVQDLRSGLPIDIDLIRNEFLERLKEACGNKQELERLQKENDHLRGKIADSEKLQQHDTQQARSRTPTIIKPTKYSLKAKTFTVPPPPLPPTGDRNIKSPLIYKQPSHKPAARQSSHVQKQHNGEGLAAQNFRQRSKSNSFRADIASTPSGQGESPQRGLAPGHIRPFSSIPSSSPLTDIESIIDNLDSVNSHAELQRMYQSKGHKQDSFQYGESSANSQPGAHRDKNVEDDGSAKDEYRNVASSESDEEFSTLPRKMKGLSHAEESHQRRTAKPLRSVLKKTSVAGSADLLQEQINALTSLAGVRKPTSQSTRKSNAGLSSISRSGASTYNRIASGNVKNTQDSHPDKQGKSDAMLVWEPPPPVGRFKRQGSTSALAVAARPAKAPRSSLGPRTSRTVIPDSQEQM